MRRALFLVATLLVAGAARADPYRLRADAIVAGEASPVGLLVLQGESHGRGFMDAEALVWTGSGDHAGDVVVASVRARDPGGRGEVRVGRMLLATGAVRPIHLDGADVIGRAPWGTSLELFGGYPVDLAGTPRDFDWVLGQRLAQRAGDSATVGLSWMERRDAGALAQQELGVDAATAPTRWLDGAGAASLDLLRPGLVEARGSLAARTGPARFEAFAVRRSPSRMLPATSLFAALGDVPSTRAGLAGRFRLFPRLDLESSSAIASIGGGPGGEARALITLRLDDRGDGALGLELRRALAPEASWSGARATARVPLGRGVSASTELEIAAPDHPNGRGVAWPWGLVAIAWKPPTGRLAGWEAAAAAEASASPSSTSSAAVLVRIGRTWGWP